MNLEEQAYLDLLNKIITSGSKRQDRTGVGTLSLFGTNLRFSLDNGKIPLLTTKKVFVRGAIEELLFFLRGDTDTKILENKGINIWKGNTSREFLDSRGLHHLPEGSLGLGYGAQWRNFNGTTNTTGIDQLAILLDNLKHNPYSRRHIITAWNPSQLKDMALEPCHCFYQFYVDNGKLSLQWYQRSIDTALGLPFNIVSYGILTHIVAKTVGLLPGELIFCGGDTHLYLNHIEPIKEQLNRIPYDFPTLNIKKDLTSIKDIEALDFSDFEIVNYKYYPSIKMEMVI